jgi:hypothetical protein
VLSIKINHCLQSVEFYNEGVAKKLDESTHEEGAPVETNVEEPRNNNGSAEVRYASMIALVGYLLMLAGILPHSDSAFS